MSERLPSVRAREVIRALERAGYAVSQANLGQPLLAGSHQRSYPARKVTIPIHGSTNLKRGTLRSIIAQAGLTVAEFVALL